MYFDFLIAIGLIKVIKPEKLIPKWFGLVGQSINSQEYYVAVMPLNLVFAALEAVVRFVQHGGKAIPPTARESYLIGFNDGARSRIDVTDTVVNSILDQAGIEPGAVPLRLYKLIEQRDSYRAQLFNDIDDLK